MKKSNSKIRPRRISRGLKNLTIKKPSAKGVALKSVNKEIPNFKRGAVAPPPPQPLLAKEGKGVVNGRSGGVFQRGMGRWFSAAFVSIAIIGIVVFFQFAPENARKAWVPAVALAVILTANFSRAIIKLVNPPRATERSCGVFICSLYSYNNG